LSFCILFFTYNFVGFFFVWIACFFHNNHLHDSYLSYFARYVGVYVSIINQEIVIFYKHEETHVHTITSSIILVFASSVRTIVISCSYIFLRNKGDRKFIFVTFCEIYNTFDIFCAIQPTV
jgi:hypothetical protein